MGQNAFYQSDCIICKRTKSLEQINQIAWFFPCWDQSKKIKFLSIILFVGIVETGCGKSGYEALKLNVFQEWIVGINWFSTWCYKFRKAKSYFNDFRVGVAHYFMRP